MSEFDRKDIFNVFKGATLDEIMDGLLVAQQSSEAIESFKQTPGDLVDVLYDLHIIYGHDDLIQGITKAHTLVTYYMSHSTECDEALERWNS